jgi:hypothetical protein
MTTTFEQRTLFFEFQGWPLYTGLTVSYKMFLGAGVTFDLTFFDNSKVIAFLYTVKMPKNDLFLNCQRKTK